MNGKPAQASMEYVMVAGFVALVIIPTAFVFYMYASDSAEEIDQAQIEKFGRDVVSTAEIVYYLGAPSRIVLDERLPKNVQSVSVDRDPTTGTYLFAIAASLQSGTANLTFPTKVRIQGSFRSDDINPGQKSVWITAQAAPNSEPYVDVRFGNWRRVFVTSAAYAPNFGLAGADANCQAAANSASLGGVWVAWLSTSGTDAKNRAGDHTYMLVDQATVVANDMADLTDGSIQNAISINELGSPTGPAEVWTGTTSGGVASAVVKTCTDWSGADSARAGYTTLTDGRWTDFGFKDCAGSARLYCVEK